MHGKEWNDSTMDPLYLKDFWNTICNIYTIDHKLKRTEIDLTN